jgi:lipid-binding SYLF domain-containing protein
MMTKHVSKFTLIALLSVFFSTYALAEAAPVIDAKVDVALKKFEERKGASEFLKKAYAVLVFPSVVKGGFGIGGEYGEGAVRVDGKTIAYYNITSASFGFQLGLQKTSYLFAFASKEVLDNFMKSNGWEAGVDGAITVAKWGAGKDIGSISFEKPIYAFVFGAKGFMYNLTFEGTKFTRIVPQ